MKKLTQTIKMEDWLKKMKEAESYSPEEFIPMMKVDLQSGRIMTDNRTSAYWRVHDSK